MAMREFDAETARRIALLDQIVGAALGEIDYPNGTDGELQLTYLDVIERNLKLLREGK